MQKELRCPIDCWEDEDWAAVFDCLYQTAMEKGAVMPPFPSYLKGHQRMEESRREKASDTPETATFDRVAIRSRITELERELQALKRMAEDDELNTPHRQLELF